MAHMDMEGITARAGVSVVICAYTEDRWNDLVAAVESVERQSTPPSEIILVIDHNDTLLARAHHRFPAATVVENAGPRGDSAARNTGVSKARGSIVAFLDDDAVAEPDWLCRLLVPYDDERVLGVGGRLDPIWLTHRPGWFPDEFLWVVGCTYRGLPEETAPVRNLIGASMSIRRSVLEGIGGFRTELARVGTRPFGCEETELCIRAAQFAPSGVFIHEPRARAHHRVPSARTRFAYFRRYCFDEGYAKALLSRFVESASGLAAERDYVSHTLPSGIRRELTSAVVNGDPNGIKRAAAIVSGIAFGTAGYLAGRLGRSRTSAGSGSGVRQVTHGFEPPDRVWGGSREAG